MMGARIRTLAAAGSRQGSSFKVDCGVPYNYPTVIKEQLLRVENRLGTLRHLSSVLLGDIP